MQKTDSSPAFEVSQLRIKKNPKSCYAINIFFFCCSEDEAIVSAVKTSASMWQVNPNTLQRQLFSNNPALLKAEDLEKNFGENQLR